VWRTQPIRDPASIVISVLWKRSGVPEVGPYRFFWPTTMRYPISNDSNASK
jgi:hypothetical protein